MKQVVIVELNFIAPPTEIVVKLIWQTAAQCDVRRNVADGDVVDEIAWNGP
jgi:hypothetical protein